MIAGKEQLKSLLNEEAMHALSEVDTTTSVYKGTHVYAREHNGTLVNTHGYEGRPL